MHKVLNFIAYPYWNDFNESTKDGMTSVFIVNIMYLLQSISKYTMKTTVEVW